MHVHLTPKSANAKTGPIPVSTTERARYPGRCAATGAAIRPGALIYYDTSARRATLAPVVNTITLIGERGPREFIRNARGRCEDAPCCGCCTI